MISATVPRRTRWSLQLRLTLLYGGLFLLAGTLLITITYGFVAGSQLTSSPEPPVPQQPSAAGGVLDIPQPAIADDFADRLAEQRARDLDRLLMADGIALGIMTILSGGLGWLIARRALRPLRVMAGTARMISERNLHRRLAVAGPQDEIKELADTFDGLLGRLEGAFEAQRRFVANASHELRTPLTVERSLLEVVLADETASTADLRHTCERVLANNEHQERLIEALLTLARSQRGLDRRTPLELAEVTGDLLSSRDSAGLRVETNLSTAHTEGDRPLVERLVTNLVDNAIRYNVPSGWVRVWTGTREGRAALRISNSGPEVRPADIDLLFQPFQRLEPARTATGARDGLGIGLSIVAAIATAHGATIEACPVPGGGLDVLVQFPTIAASGERAAHHRPAVRHAVATGASGPPTVLSGTRPPRALGRMRARIFRPPVGSQHVPTDRHN